MRRQSCAKTQPNLRWEILTALDFFTSRSSHLQGSWVAASFTQMKTWDGQLVGTAVSAGMYLFDTDTITNILKPSPSEILLDRLKKLSSTGRQRHRVCYGQSQH